MYQIISKSGSTLNEYHHGKVKGSPGTIRKDNKPYNPTQIALFLHLARMSLWKQMHRCGANDLPCTGDLRGVHISPPWSSRWCHLARPKRLCASSCWTCVPFWRTCSSFRTFSVISLHFAGIVYDWRCCADVGRAARGDLSAICVSFIVWRVKWSPSTNGRTRRT